MNDNIYGIDLGTSNFKVFNKATGKIMKEKTTSEVIPALFFYHKISYN